MDCIYSAFIAPQSALQWTLTLIHTPMGAAAMQGAAHLTESTLG